MARATGIGGVFFRSRDPEALYRWYEQHLGVTREPGDGVTFHWECPGETVWGIFPDDTTYFGPSRQSFMINFRVDNLDELLAALTTNGVEVNPRCEEYPYGKFGWIVDPDGNRVELWEPTIGVPAPSPD